MFADGSTLEKSNNKELKTVIIGIDDSVQSKFCFDFDYGTQLRPHPPEKALYCNEHVCMSVCEHIWKTTHPIFTNFCACICCHGLVLLWWHCNMFCTSGFMDDVIFTQWAIWRHVNTVPANDVIKSSSAGRCSTLLCT